MLWIVEGRVGFIKIGVVATISRFFSFFFLMCITAWNIAKYELSLIHIFPYIGRIVCVFSKYGKIQISSCPYTGKYRLEKVHISAYFKQYMLALLSSNVKDSYKFFLKISVILAVCTLNSSSVQDFTKGSVKVHSFV